MEERRKSFRFPVQLNAVYLGTDKKTWENLLVIDISREGMGFGMQESIQPGTILKTQVEIPPKFNKVELTGTVKWSMKIEGNPSFDFMGGMEFLEIDEEAREALLEHAYDTWDDKKSG